MKAFDIPGRKIPPTNSPFQKFWHEIPDTIKSWKNMELTIPFFKTTNNPWLAPDQIDYLEYRLLGGPSGDTIYLNHPNWPDMPKNNQEFSLIDGLQRITAVQRFMSNDIPVFGQYIKNFTRPLPLTATLTFIVTEIHDLETLLWYYTKINTKPRGNYATTNNLKR